MPAHLDVRLFGEPSFRYDEAPWRFVAPPRALPMLAWLVLRRERISRSQLAAIFWPDESRESGRANLRRHLHRLAQALPPGVEWFLADPTGVAWNPEAPARIDVLAFEDGDGIDAYAGDLLPECYDEPIVAARERLRALYLERCLQRATDARRERRFTDADRLLERIFAVDPLRESALRLAMSVKYEAGDRSAALATYDRFASALATEMRVEPMPETRALRDSILASDAIPSQGAPTRLALPRDREPLPFAGRRTEIEDLRAAWRRAAGGRGNVVFLSGEPGIGKSRLVSELAVAVEGEGGRVLIGATSKPESQPYQAFVEALRRGLPLIGESDVEFVWLSVLAALVPEIEALVPGLPGAAPLEGAAARRRLYDAIAHCFEAIARARPLLLVLEDLHWANAGVIEALDVLARRAGALPVLVVATYRAEEIDAASPLHALRRTLQREHRASALSLRPLEREDIAQMLALSASIRGAPPDFAERLFARSEGNPLFVTQLVRDFVEGGALPEEPALSLRDVVLARTERLDPVVRTMLEVAATVGTEFMLETVAVVGGWRDYEVLDGLTVMIERSLIREAGGGVDYAFTHALVRAAIYESTDPEVRSARHGRIAASLAKLPEFAGSAALGAHWLLAGRAENAADAYLAAARAALAIFARDAAADYAERALAATARDATAFAAAMVGARALSRFGDVERCGKLLDRALATSDAVDARARFGLAEEREKHARQLVDARASAVEVARMVAAAEELGDDGLLATAYDARGCMEALTGRLGEAAQTFRDGIALASRAGAAHVEARLRIDLVHMLARSGDLDGAVREIETQRGRLAADAPLERRLNFLFAEAAILETIEDHEGCGRVGAEMLSIGTAAGNVHAQALGSALTAIAAFSTGDPDTMRATFQRSVEMFAPLNAQRAITANRINWASFELELGELDAARALLEAASEQKAGFEGDDITAAILTARAELAALEGDGVAAAAMAAESVRLARTVGEAGITAGALVTAGIAASIAGDPAAAAAALEEAREHLRRTGVRKRLLLDALALLVDAAMQRDAQDDARRYLDELAAESGKGRYLLSPRVRRALASRPPAVPSSAFARVDEDMIGKGAP